MTNPPYTRFDNSSLSNQVSASVVEKTNKATLQGFVVSRTDSNATVYTDDAAAYNGLLNHDSVRHSVGEYVKDQVHTNGIESFWSMLKRGHYGTFHKMSPKHLQRYVNEFAGRHNERELNTPAQLKAVVHGMEKKRLRYRDLIQDNGLDSGART